MISNYFNVCKHFQCVGNIGEKRERDGLWGGKVYDILTNLHGHMFLANLPV